MIGITNFCSLFSCGASIISAHSINASLPSRTWRRIYAKAVDANLLSFTGVGNTCSTLFVLACRATLWDRYALAVFFFKTSIACASGARCNRVCRTRSDAAIHRCLRIFGPIPRDHHHLLSTLQNRKFWMIDISYRTRTSSSRRRTPDPATPIRCLVFLTRRQQCHRTLGHKKHHEGSDQAAKISHAVPLWPKDDAAA